MFTIHFNRHSDRDKRRFLRNNPTESEKILWQWLRKKKILGYKFRRQYGIDAFIVDFYCPRAKLAIEIDGEIHKSREVVLDDRKRQEYIEQFGITFLRFTNAEIENDIRQVISLIEQKIDYLTGLSKG
jgi:very-short-patch-repair endonuclease